MYTMHEANIVWHTTEGSHRMYIEQDGPDFWTVETYENESQEETICFADMYPTYGDALDAAWEIVTTNW